MGVFTARAYDVDKSMQPSESFSWKAFAVIVAACLAVALYAVFFFVSWTGPGRSYEVCFTAEDEVWNVKVSDFAIGEVGVEPVALWLTIGAHPVVATLADEVFTGVVLVDDFTEPEFKWDGTLLSPSLSVESCTKTFEKILN